ncbi:carbohydrate ABC transporter substrate-binding protein (CUT1 family) [Kribbella sp. VKM Ac-2569]|uniref:ABC transporter substrate-binding protein n=1 Tax=Kribbella sp. VKM Ac-2569 TaxID=2512220 RepID=UPI00102CA813|nr:sugar ABC transporter substrate-binding protein [Kribbella sp. VKM Ac-2569]RZT17036.1 carbohydrate ABC transporter substrate-binding protein (CUT1 family) [Kribbella sp. VKM Ac-2569]
MRRIVLAVATAVLAVPLALAGCGGSGGGSSDGTVRLAFRQFDPPTEIGGLQAVVKAWNDKHPDIQVKLETLTGPDSAQQFAREANSGSGPDVVQIANVNVKDLAKPKILKSLDEFAGKTPPETPLDQYLALDLAKFDDKTWALPWTVDTFALAYRPELLAAAGLKPPTTWDELAGAATKLSDAKAKRSGFCFTGASGPGSGQWFPINYYLWSHGQTLVTKDGDRWKVGVTQEALQSEIDWFNNLFASGATAKSMIAVESLTDPQLVDGLAKGTCAMTLMAPQTFRKAKAADPTLKTAPVPDGLKDGATHLGGRMLGINAATDHPDQAWEFLKYLNSAEAFTKIAQYPAATTVLTKMKVPAGEEGYQQQLPHAKTFGRYISGPVPVTTLTKITNAQFGAVYSGQTDSHTAAANIISQITSELESR